MKKALLIVDPQYDFITGTLPVPGAESAMDSLAEYIKAHNDEYECKMVTVDWHPADHMSFAPNSGPWPTHCVRFSKGAAVWDAIFQAVYATRGDVMILTKGIDRDREEYSIFQNDLSRDIIIQTVRQRGIERIDICGLAGDVCVLSTLTDGRELFGRDLFCVLPQFSPSLDGGAKLNAAL